uniref:aspartic proteinase CDR1-like isoform X2 n=1 Tax=Fragaria vesca subsp. vesca TaxID=101020 RepID=UPI0005CB68DB|nr:PREDICTED: aspartic proteinase CDR1-like isoform X2 [Fragaria vesca subsp. vesca]
MKALMKSCHHQRCAKRKLLSKILHFFFRFKILELDSFSCIFHTIFSTTMVAILVNHPLPIAMALALSVAYLLHFSLVQADRNGGFSVKLIHRNSPLSPLHNPSETPSQRVTNALQRSINRANFFGSTSLLPSSNDPESTIISDKGEYLMKISIGTPPVEISGVADTASDLTWIQCMPCRNCYKQKAPLYDPKNSNTYKVVFRPSSQCQSVSGTSCSDEDICYYKRFYRDGSYSNGVVSTETITFNSTSLGQTISLPQIIIGCGQNNSGLSNEDGSSMIGLSRGSMSLISQMDSSIDGKFSYCLVPAFSQLNSSSKMSFGNNAVVSGATVVSTPLLSDLKSYYFIKLEAMSVGRKRLQYNSTLMTIAPGRGNIIVDSGTTLTMLPKDFYDRLELTVTKAIRLKRVKDASRYLSLCYKTKSTITAPIITAHFTGADVKLKASNTFIRVSMDVVCFAFKPITQGNAIFGNMAQTNFLIGYDLKKEFLSFKPTDCTKH